MENLPEILWFVSAKVSSQNYGSDDEKVYKYQGILMARDIDHVREKVNNLYPSVDYDVSYLVLDIEAAPVGELARIWE